MGLYQKTCREGWLWSMSSLEKPQKGTNNSAHAQPARSPQPDVVSLVSLHVCQNDETGHTYYPGVYEMGSRDPCMGNSEDGVLPAWIPDSPMAEQWLIRK